MASQVVNIRSAFVARPGYFFIDVDYSQIEFRLSAAFAGERSLLKGFLAGNDYYSMCYANMKGLTLEEVTKAMRAIGKIIALGQNYGQGAKTLSRLLKCDTDEAIRLIEEFWNGQPATKDAKERLVAQARRYGGITTWLDKTWRSFPGLHFENYPNTGETPEERRLRADDIRHQVAKTERQIWNHLVQGSAAEWMRTAMLRCYRALKDRNVHQLLTVHDEILFECGDEEPVHEITEIIRQGFEFKVRDLPANNYDLYPDGFYVPADFDYGNNWGQLHSLDKFIALREEQGRPLNTTPCPELVVEFSDDAKRAAVERPFAWTPPSAQEKEMADDNVQEGLDVIQAATEVETETGPDPWSKAPEPPEPEPARLTLQLVDALTEKQAQFVKAVCKQHPGPVCVRVIFKDTEMELPDRVDPVKFVEWVRKAGLTVEQTSQEEPKSESAPVRFA